MVDLNKTDKESRSKLKDLRRQITQMTIRAFPSFWGRLVIIGATLIAYAIAYILTDRYLGQAIGILAILPVMITAWFLGQHLGSMAALLIFPVNMILLSILGQPLSTLLQAPNLALMASLFLIASVVGRQQQLVDQLRLGLKSSLKGELEFWGSRERYQALDTAFTGIAVTDSIERLMYCNTTLADMLGYVPDEFEDKFLDQFMEPSEISKFRENINLMKKGIPTKYEVSMRRKDGEHRTMLFSSVPRFAVDGSYEGILSVIIDITDRKQAEEALRESEEKFRTLAEQSPNMIFINKMGKVVYANPLCEEIMGYSREEFYSPDFEFINLVAPDSRELIRMNYEKHKEGKDIPPYEYAIITKGGERIEAIVTTKLIHYGDTHAILGIVTDVTDRIQADEALRASEERYRAIFEQAADSIFLIDADSGELVEYNDQAFEALGYTREEFKSVKIADFEVIETPEEIEKHMKYVLKEGSDRFMTRHQTKDGRIRDIQVGSRSISIHGKDYIQTIARDITDRVEAVNALRESEEKYKQLIENANDIIYGTDIDGNIIFVNPVAERVIGYSEEELIGKNFIDLIHPDWGQDADRFYRAQFAEKNLNTYHEFPVIAKDGTEIWIGQNVQLAMEGEKIIGFQAVARDITDRKLWEATIRDSEERFRRLSEVAFEGIVIHDNGIIIDANVAFADILGYSPSELIGMNALDFATEESREKASQAISTGSEEIYVGEAVRRDGSTIQVEIQGRNIPFEGKVIRAIAVRDITDRMQMEEALRKSQEEAVRAQKLLIALNQAAQAVHRARIKEEIYQTIGDEITQLGYQTGILTLTEDRTHLRVSYLSYESKIIKTAEKVAGLSTQDYQFHIKEGGLFDQLINEGKTIFISEGFAYLSEGLPDSTRALGEQLARIFDIKQAIFAPLKCGDAIHDLLFITGSNLEESDAIAITAFANQTAIALENSLLLDQANTD